MNPEQILSSLYSKRKRFVDSADENDFSGGLRLILTETYPDQAHFIYELLQNAEDAKATKIDLELFPDKLVVTHDGKRIFTDKDVDSITNIANSTKLLKGEYEEAAIGKFGIGFKSVFAYTSTPQIHSGGFHFEIRNLCVPTPIDTIKIESELTRFIIPFNEPGKSADVCFREISTWLNQLNEDGILFLRNLCHISWSIPGQMTQILSRKVHPKNLIEIVKGNQVNTKSGWWLVLNKNISLSKGKFSNQHVAIAFSIKPEEEIGIDPEEWNDFPGSQGSIQPLPESKLFIYFPAAKESTQLRFHIHGPYTSTPSRDSISHDKFENRSILKSTSQLLVEQLPKLKEWGLIIPQFLAVLPNDDDVLADFYDPIRKVVLETFLEQALLPLYPDQPNKPNSVTHARGKMVVQGGQNLKRLLSLEQLSFFCGKSYWAPNVAQNHRVDKFLKALGIPNIQNKEFLEFIDKKFYSTTHPSDGTHLEWLARQGIPWLIKFYAAISSALSQSTFPETRLHNWMIVLDSGNEVYWGSKSYFPSDDIKLDEVGHFITIHPEILEQLTKEDSFRVLDALKKLGVKELKEADILKKIISQNYAQNRFPTAEIHYQHMQKFVKAIQQGVLKLEDIKSHPIFRASSGSKQNMVFLKGDQFYLDEPFELTNLSNIFKNTRKKYSFWFEYSKIPGFVNIAKLLGAVNKLEISKTKLSQLNPNYSALTNDWKNKKANYKASSEDYWMENLDEIFKLKNIACNLIVWNTLRQAGSACFYASYSPNQSTDARRKSSRLIETLKNSAWIPDNQGTFRKPSEITRDLLPDKFIYDNTNSWLNEIEFGKNARQQIKEKEEYKSKIVAAKEVLGSDLVESLIGNEKLRKELKNQDAINQFLQFIETIKIKNSFQEEKPDYETTLNQQLKRRASKYDSIIQEDLDDRHSLKVGPQNADRYVGQVTQEAQKRISSVSEQSISRSVSIQKWPEALQETRIFLQQEYAGKCQICSDTFKKRDGQPYFEGVYLVPRSKAIWADMPGNIVCLCAGCCARFEHGHLETDNLIHEIKDLIIENYAEKPISFSIKLCNEEKKITFSPRHLLQLKGLLESKVTVKIGDALELQEIQAKAYQDFKRT